jgi:hypothetical protein
MVGGLAAALVIGAVTGRLEARSSGVTGSNGSPPQTVRKWTRTFRRTMSVKLYQRRRGSHGME